MQATNFEGTAQVTHQDFLRMTHGGHRLMTIFGGVTDLQAQRLVFLVLFQVEMR